MKSYLTLTIFSLIFRSLALTVGGLLIFLGVITLPEAGEAGTGLALIVGGLVTFLVMYTIGETILLLIDLVHGVQQAVLLLKRNTLRK